MFDQLLAYLSNNNLLCINQFGFRPGHSTELAALRLVDHLIAQMDMYNVPTNIYIDLSKAFDTLDHSILLLSKLKYYGVTGCSYDLLSSYLTGRSQYVEFSGHKSNTLPISTGVCVLLAQWLTWLTRTVVVVTQRCRVQSPLAARTFPEQESLIT